MSTETAPTALQHGVRLIKHQQRDKSADVNPLLQSSNVEIISADDNYVVGRQKSGHLHEIKPEFKLTLKERLFNGFEKYYEVDKRNYPFVVSFRNLASAQATFKFHVDIEFSLKVVDPCVIVRENQTSLLDCILQDLKSVCHSITSKFQVEKTDEAQMSLQTALLSFACPSFLKMTCGVVSIMPDEAAKMMLRQLEETNLQVELIKKKTTLDSTSAIGSKITEAHANAEEHQIQVDVSGVVGKVLGLSSTIDKSS